VKKMKFMNPENNYVETSDNCGLWVFLFPQIYFAAKGVWTHLVASVLLMPFTLGLSWLIYPFFAGQVVRTHYLRKGWKEV